MTTENEKKALAEYLECDIDSIVNENWNQWGLNVYKSSKEEFAHEYAIGTEEQTNIACYEAIKSNAWAFTSSFLAEMTELPQEVFAALQDKCEDANEPILKLIEKTCGLDAFVDAAISSDGRANFLATYDGCENQEGNFFIYKL